MGIKICPQCGGKVSDARNDCPHCQYTFTSIKKCPDCEEQVDVSLSECPVCGHVWGKETNEQIATEDRSEPKKNIVQDGQAAEKDDGLTCPYCNSAGQMQIGKDLYMCAMCKNKFLDTRGLPTPPLASKKTVKIPAAAIETNNAKPIGSAEEGKKPTAKKGALISMWAFLGFTVYSYLINVILALCINGSLYAMFLYILDGYIAGFICMGVGIIGYIISLCFLFKDTKAYRAIITSLILMAVLYCVTFSPLVLHEIDEYNREESYSDKKPLETGDDSVSDRPTGIR